MIVNLYVDHMMSQSPTSSDDILTETRDHSKLFSEAAARIGMSPSEYREFQSSLLDGNVTYVRLPRHIDAMSANRRGTVYAVKNAVVTQPGMSWRVALADGNVVYVPQVCGNLSLVRHPAVAVARKKPAVIAHHRAAPFVPALGTVAETPVVLAPPADVVAAAPAVVAAAPLAAAAPAGGSHFSPFLLAIPAAIAGIVAGTTHNGSPAAPPCNQGSNIFNACQK